VLAAGWGPALRAAIFHLDIAKTHRAALAPRLTAQGLALDVHNEAAAAIRATPIAREAGLPGGARQARDRLDRGPRARRQHVRGEDRWRCSRRWSARLATSRRRSPATLGVPPSGAVAWRLDALHCSTACRHRRRCARPARRRAARRLARVRDQLGAGVQAGGVAQPQRALSELAPPVDARKPRRACTRLRALARAPGGGRAADAVGETRWRRSGRPSSPVLGPALATCQLWYCEAATAGCRVAQLGVLAAAVGAPARSGRLQRRGTPSCSSAGHALRARARRALRLRWSRPRSPPRRSASC